MVGGSGPASPLRRLGPAVCGLKNALDQKAADQERQPLTETSAEYKVVIKGARQLGLTVDET